MSCGYDAGTKELDKQATIGSYAFAYCENLQEIKILAKTLGTGFCEGCTNLKYVSLSGSRTKDIPDYAFFGCKNLERILCDPFLNTIGEYAFAYCTQLSDLELAFHIKRYAYMECDSLKNVTLFWTGKWAGFHSMQTHSFRSLPVYQVL